LPRQLTTTPENSLLPTVGNGFAGVNSCLHLAFADKRGTERLVFYMRSYDYGATWLGPVEIEERTQNNTFSVAADSAGNVHLVNRRYSDNRLYYRRSSDQGVVWDSAVPMADSCDNMVLLTTRRQNVYVFNVVPGEPPYLAMRKSSDGGATWAQAIRVLQTTGFNNLTACASGSGTINLFYNYGLSGSSRVCEVRSTDDGATWSGEIPLPGVSGNCAPGDCWSHGELVFLTSAG